MWYHVSYQEYSSVLINAGSNSTRSILQSFLHCVTPNLPFKLRDYVGGEFKVMNEKFSEADYFLLDFPVASDNIVR